MIDAGFLSVPVIWWAFISICGLLQVLYVLLSSRKRRGLGYVLSLLYASVCLFRSVFPRVDVERLCFWDHWLSYIALGRLAATFAEVSFGTQFSIVTGDATFARLTSLANVFCWIAVLTTRQEFHCVEESLWAFCAIYLVLRHRGNKILGSWVWLAVPFFFYMVLIDVPMYYYRINDHVAALSISQGWRDVWRCDIVSRAPELWASEYSWMTPYFTVAVWISIALGKWIDEGGQEQQHTTQHKKVV